MVRRYLLDDRILDVAEVAEFVATSERDFAQFNFGLWALSDKTDLSFRGVCGFLAKDGKPDLLYSIEPLYWGQRLATESAQRVLAYAFHTLQLSEVVASTDRPNRGSIAVLEKLGMRRVIEEPAASDHLLLSYTLTAAEFNASRA